MTIRSVQIEIQGQQYAVRSDLDPAYIEKLALYVEEKMGQAANELPTADSLRIAVITALNLADEVFRARLSGAGIESSMLARTAEIERIVDAVLNAASSAPSAIASNQ